MIKAYFLKKWSILGYHDTLRPPSSSEFPMTLCGGGLDIFWNH